MIFAKYTIFYWQYASLRNRMCRSPYTLPQLYVASNIGFMRTPWVKLFVPPSPFYNHKQCSAQD